MRRPVPRQRWTLVFHLLALLLSATVVGCRPTPDRPTAVGEGLYDPWVGAFDREAPSALIRDQGGSLLLDVGWSPVEVVGQGRGSDRRAWVVAPRAVVRFVVPPGPVDLHARLRPLAPETVGALRTLTVTAGSREIGRETLPADTWVDLRMPLPGWLEPGTLETLGFDVGLDPEPEQVEETPRRSHVRLLEVSELAVVPRDLADPVAFLESGELTEEDGLILPIGGTYSFPVPASADVDLRWGRVEGPADAELVLTAHRHIGWETELQRAPVDDASDRSTRFQTPARSGSVLSLGVVAKEASGPDRFDSRRTVRVELPRDWLKTTPRVAPAEEETTAEAAPVFVYLVDTLRADSLSPYGAPRERTPRLDAFAAEGVVYTRAQAASAWTLPSIVSLLTGVYADRHGVMKGFEKLDSVTPLAARLEEKGYDTVALSQSFIASPAFAVDGGFGDFLVNDQLNSYSLGSPRIRRMFLEWLRSRADERPVFAYVHTVDPHAPYGPPAPWDELAAATAGSLPADQYSPVSFNTNRRAGDEEEVAHLRALYDGEVGYTDEQFGRFLDLLRHLDLYDRSLIVFVSDHGEEFGEHGGFDHGRTLYGEMIGVPLVVKYPGAEWAGERVDTPVSLVDLPPTIFDLAGWPAPPGAFDGTSWASPLRAEADGRRVVFSQVSPEPNQFVDTVDYDGMVADDFKCVHNRLGTDQFGEPAADWEAWDLTRDPAEQEALAGDDPVAVRCRSALERWRARREQSLVALPGQREEVSAETLEKLRSLGYIE